MREDLQMARCVITSVNEKYVPYLSVLLASILQNAEQGEKYEIVVLHDELTSDSQEKLKAMVHQENIQVRFINVHLHMKGYDFFVDGTSNRAYLSKEAYFRLLAPGLLPEYAFALYLDCDIVVRQGWNDIFSMDIGGYLLAGILDIWGNWECYDNRSALYQYRQRELKLTNPQEYFNSGVMMLNLEEMRASFSDNELLETAASREWKKHDQDVLNFTCKGKVLFLDYSWNLIECPSKKAWNAVPEAERTKYENCVNNPKIIHYASRKPWIIKGVFFEQDFWNSAVQSLYFEDLFTSFIEEQLHQGECFEKVALQSIRGKKIGVRFISKCILAWIKTVIYEKISGIRK